MDIINIWVFNVGDYLCKGDVCAMQLYANVLVSIASLEIAGDLSTGAFFDVGIVM